MPFNVQSLAILAAAFSLVESSPLTLPKASIDPKFAARQSLAKREVTGIACGLYSTGNEADIGEGLGEDADTITVAPRSCNRIGCYDTSGVSICNDQDADLSFPMQEAIDNMNFLKGVCHGPASGEGYYYISGQMFITDHGGYNLNIGYCNNNDPVDKPFADYNDGYPGPNGRPEVECGGNNGVECEGTQCIDGTLVMTEQTSVECGEYLAPSYIGPGATYLYSTTRTITETWTVGGFVIIDTSDLFVVSVQAGFFSSFSNATTTGDISGISTTCGDESAEGTFTCGMHVVPSCWQMAGYCEVEGLGRTPWANVAPRLTAQDGQSVYTAGICTCQNCPGADEEGAPEEDCGLECAACKS
ncbi:hypothetical protein LTR37_021006 [Vermiconidia calcicola]|uniref:Uncharacterized protein n=1 Tax=Vermiconidia calcicola TaxID=1690605 RepID=A0ACC3M9Y1_9PEZI|nr:hypothetical protein LTR37_021006 [Vermiconidia calcicola]